jgi:hypothetical protein
MNDETQVHPAEGYVPGFDQNPTVHDIREHVGELDENDKPVVPADAEPIPAGDPMDHETEPVEDQPNR